MGAPLLNYGTSRIRDVIRKGILEHPRHPTRRSQPNAKDHHAERAQGNVLTRRWLRLDDRTARRCTSRRRHVACHAGKTGCLVELPTSRAWWDRGPVPLSDPLDRGPVPLSDPEMCRTGGGVCGPSVGECHNCLQLRTLLNLCTLHLKRVSLENSVSLCCLSNSVS
jgi:hypothetical protein